MSLRRTVGKKLRELAHTRAGKRLLASTAADREELESLVDRTGGRWFRFGHAETVSFAPPAAHRSHPDRIATLLEGDYTLSQPFVAAIPDATLLPPRGVAIADGKYVLEASCLGNPELLFQHLALTLASGHAPTTGSPDETLGTATALVGSWTSGYFHWATDWLTRLEGVFEYADAVGEMPTVVIPADATPWMRASLRRVGVPSEHWHEWDGGRLHVETLLVPSVRRFTASQDVELVDVYEPRAIRWVAERIRAATNTDPGTSDDKRIYVSRNDAGTRRVKNEDEVMAALSERGFERYTLSELSFDEQVRLFASAEAVVGPHGAGLTNTLYARDATVVEFFGSRIACCYLTIAETLGLRYSYHLADAVGRDMVVDVESLTSLLERLGL